VNANGSDSHVDWTYSVDQRIAELWLPKSRSESVQMRENHTQSSRSAAVRRPRGGRDRSGPVALCLRARMSRCSAAPERTTGAAGGRTRRWTSPMEAIRWRRIWTSPSREASSSTSARRGARDEREPEPLIELNCVPTLSRTFRADRRMQAGLAIQRRANRYARRRRRQLGRTAPEYYLWCASQHHHCDPTKPAKSLAASRRKASSQINHRCRCILTISLCRLPRPRRRSRGFR
jgi:hypothetical protein